MITNALFQSTNWQTAGAGDPRGPGNQQPDGWTLTITPINAVMPWPTRHTGQGDAPALSGGPGECVHKLNTQLPLNELFGTARALLVLPNTDKVYKGFGNHAQAFTLSQLLHESPGTKKQYTLFVLAETPDRPTPPNADLEADHFRVRFAVGGVTVESEYGDMKGHKTIGGNERAWNQFVIPSFEFPASGEAQITITCQQNWPGSVDFFIAGVTEQTIGGTTTPPLPAGDDDLTLIGQLNSSAANDVNMAAMLMEGVRVKLQMIEGILQRRAANV